MHQGYSPSLKSVVFISGTVPSRRSYLFFKFLFDIKDEFLPLSIIISNAVGPPGIFLLNGKRHYTNIFPILGCPSSQLSGCFLENGSRRDAFAITCSSLDRQKWI